MEFSRRWLETISAPFLTKLHLMPRWIFPIATVAILLLGLFIQGPIGALFLVLLVLLLGWLLLLSWPVISTGSKVIRLAALGLLIIAAWMQLNS